MNTPAPTRCPYLGLRPFGREDADLFFGREEQVDDLLERLADHRLVAVVGASGCGKSSLVSAGLIPDLEEGLLDDGDETPWFIAETHPGDRPLDNLTDALLECGALGERWVGCEGARDLLAAELRTSPLGMVRALGAADMASRGRLLLVVDQFEEIFRYYNLRDAAEATSFVNLLLASVREQGIPVYVILTMRSDFLGDCALFQGLPEAMNDSQFLTPRLTRRQWRAAIRGPALEVGAQVEALLLNRILNDMGADPDQLPLMQHALMRVWHQAVWEAEDHTEGLVLTADQYRTVGGIKEALSRHADEEYRDLDEEGQRIAQVVFRSLSEREAQRRDTRRPVQLGITARVAGASPEDVIRVVDAFRQPDCSFLVPPPPKVLTSETILDIGHESLIRQWRTMKTWVEAEHDSALMYSRLLETAHLWDRKEAGLWGTPDLDNALAWREREAPTAAWAERYGGDFELTMTFLDASVRAREEQEALRLQREKRRRRLTSWVAMFLAVVAVGALILWNNAREAKLEAEGALDLVEEKTRKIYEEKEKNKLLSGQAILSKAMLLMAQKHSYLQRVALLAFEAREHGGGIGAEVILEGVMDRLPRLVKTFAAGESSFTAGTLSPDGSLLATAHRNWSTNPPSGYVRIWDTETWQGLPRMGHPGELKDLRFTKDSSRLLTTCADHRARLWDTATGGLVRTWGDETAPCTAAALDPEDARVAVASGEGRVEVRSINDDGILTSFLLKGGPVLKLEFQSRNDFLLVANSERLGVWDIHGSVWLKEDEREGGESALLNPFYSTLLWSDKDDKKCMSLVDLTMPTPQPTKFCHDDAVSFAFFSSDGAKILSGGYDMAVRYWNVFLGQQQTFMHQGLPVAASILEDANVLATASSDGTARVWDLASGTEMGRAIHDGGVAFAELLPGRSEFVTGGDQGFGRIWNYNFDRTVNLLGQGGTVLDAVFSDDGGFVVCGGRDGFVYRWTADRGLHAGKANDGTAINALAAIPQQEASLSCNAKGEVTRWSWSDDTDAPYESVDTSPTDIAVTPAGDRFAVAGTKGVVAVWFTDSDDTTAVLHPGHRGEVRRVVFSPDGETLLSAGEDGTLRLQPIGKGREPLGAPVVLDHGAGLRDAAFRPGHSGQVLSAGDAQGAILWDVATGLKLQGFKHDMAVFSAAFDSTGARLVTASWDKTARIWDVDTGEELAIVRHDEGVKHAAFSPDGRFIATASWDHTARIWDAQSGKEVGIRLHKGPVTKCVFSPKDPGILLTVGSEPVARLWHWEQREVTRDELCSRVHRNLTRIEWESYGLDPDEYRKTCPKLP